MLADQPEVSVRDLASLFGVAPMTVRRDLEELEHRGQVTRTHGGAVLSAPAVIEFQFLQKSQNRLMEKAAIARKAAAMVSPGMTIVLDTGTTTLEVAKAIRGVRDLTVLTSSLAIASALYAQDNLDLVLLGGSVRRRSPDLSGPLTEENLSRFRPQLAFLGVDAADRHGLYTTDMGVAGVSEAMIAGATKAVLVTDSSKFGKTAFTRFASWDQIARVITDSGLAPADRRWLKRAVRSVSCTSISRRSNR